MYTKRIKSKLYKIEREKKKHFQTTERIPLILGKFYTGSFLSSDLVFRNFLHHSNYFPRYASHVSDIGSFYCDIKEASPTAIHTVFCILQL